MKNIIYKLTLSIIIVSAFIFSGCIHRNFEEPPVTEIPVGRILTIQDVIQIYTDSVFPTKEPYKFINDYSVFAVVTMDDKIGNIYKAAYIQDNSGAINLRLQSSGGLYKGDSIRLNLKNIVLSDYNGMLQLDSVHVDNNIVKIKTGIDISPEVVRIGQITDRHAARLVKLEDVEFVSRDIGKIFANEYVTENRTLENCNGDTILVRTSGYASFASEKVPSGKGSIVGVLGKYNDDWQLYIRYFSEIKMDGRRCGEPFFYESFDGVANNEDINIEGWKNINQTGNIKWKGNVSSDNSYASIRNDGNENSTWLILPKQNLENVFLKFVTRALNISSSKLSVLISKNYDGGNSPQNFTWTTLPAVIASGTQPTESGDINLSSYNGEFYIAFKFEGAQGNQGLFHLDDIQIFTND